MGKNSKQLAELHEVRVQTLEETTNLLTIDDFDGNEVEYKNYLLNIYDEVRKIEYRHVCRNEGMKLYNLEKYGRKYGVHENNSIWIGYSNLLGKLPKGSAEYNKVKEMIDNSAASRSKAITEKSIGIKYNGGQSCAIGANSTLAAISGAMGYDGKDNFYNVTAVRNSGGENDALCAVAVGNTSGVPEENCFTKEEVRRCYGKKISVADALEKGIIGVGSVFAKPRDGGTGHARVIAGIIRDANGKITHVTISETNSCNMKTYPISALKNQIFQNGMDTEDVINDKINDESIELGNKSPEEIIAEINKAKERTAGVINELHETETFCDDNGYFGGMQKFVGKEIEQEKRECSEIGESINSIREESIARELKKKEEERKERKKRWDDIYVENRNDVPAPKFITREVAIGDIDLTSRMPEAERYKMDREQLEEILYLPDDENIFKKARRFVLGKRTNPSLPSELREFAEAKIENLKYLEEQARLRESLPRLAIFDEKDTEQKEGVIRTQQSVRAELERLEKYKNENKDNLSKEEAKALDKYIKSLKNEEKFRKEMEEKGLNDDLARSFRDVSMEIFGIKEEDANVQTVAKPEVSVETPQVEPEISQVKTPQAEVSQAEVSQAESVVETPQVETPVVEGKAETKAEMKVQVDKSEIKTESAKARVELENGKFTQRVRKDIIEKLTPIYGKYAEDIYVKAISYPKYFDDALGINRSTVSSKALLEDLLSFEGENVEKAIAYVKANPKKDIKTKSKKTTSSSKQSKSELSSSDAKPSSNKVYYTKGGYKCQMPYEIAEEVMGVLKKKESKGSYHYIDANGVWTNVGSTYSNNKKEFVNIFGKSTCKLINIAEDVVRDNNSIYVYYSLDGKNWTKAVKGSGGKGDLVLKRIQAKTRDGAKVFISSKPGGKGNIVEYERIGGGGFIIKKVNGQSIADPGWEVAENLNMQIMDKHYELIKDEIHSDNWKELSVKQKVDLMYAHYHHPGRAKNAVKSYGLKRKLPAYKLDFETDTTTHKTVIRDVKVPVNKRGKGR